MPHLLLADDHPVIRKGLKGIINKFLPRSTIDEAGDGDAVLQMIMQENYDLVLLDISMPDMDSLILVRKILSVKPQTKIIMFSMYEESLYAQRYLEIGAKGYLQKDAERGDIKAAVTMVLANKRYISPALKQKLIADLKEDTPNPFEKLSAREFEITQHLVRGEPIAEISKRLHLHTSTVGTYKARIFEKTGCSNIIDLYALAKAYNIISS